jgi:hypothetical protein
MAKFHAAEYGRTRAEEYRSKAENCRVQAERASGDRKAKWLDLADGGMRRRITPHSARHRWKRGTRDISTFDGHARLVPGTPLLVCADSLSLLSTRDVGRPPRPDS